MAQPPDFTNRPPRVDLRRSAVLIASDGGETDVTILDVSSGGFRLEIEDSPKVGELVKLRVEHRQEFPAQILWVLGAEAGGVFLAPIDHSRLA